MEEAKINKSIDKTLYYAMNNKVLQIRRKSDNKANTKILKVCSDPNIDFVKMNVF